MKRGWTLLVGSNGNPKRVGNCVYVAEPRDFLFASFLIGAKPTDPNRVDSEFLYRLLSSKPVQNDISQSVQGSTGLSNMDLKSLKGLHVPIPPLPEQRKIATVLSSVDDAIEKTQAIIDQVQVVKRGLMQELLTRGLPARHTRFKQTKIGEMPDEWTVTALRDCASIGNGITPSTKRQEYWDQGTISWLPTGKVNDRFIDSANVYVTDRAVRETSLRVLPIGTLLVAMIGQGKTRGKVARLAIEACINQNFAYVIPRDVSSWFLFYVLEHQYDALRNSGRGSNQDALNCSIIKEFRVPLPSPDEQKKIAETLRALDRRLDFDRHNVKFLGHVKSALMSVLLTGELCVAPDAEAT